MEKQFLHVGGGQLLDVDGVGVGERLVDAGRERHAHVPQQEDRGVVHQRARNRRRPGSEEEVDFYFIVEFQARMIFCFFSFLRSFLCPLNFGFGNRKNSRKRNDSSRPPDNVNKCGGKGGRDSSSIATP